MPTITSSPTSLYESRKDLRIYIKLLGLLEAYIFSYPTTQLHETMSIIARSGMSILPKDEKALSILEFMLDGEEPTPIKVQKLSVLKFKDLPFPTRPEYKDGNGNCAEACWCREDKIFSNVMDLFCFNHKDGIPADGYWSDRQGQKVSLVGLDNN